MEFFLEDMEEKKNPVTYPSGPPGSDSPQDFTKVIFSVLLIVRIH